MFRNLLLIILFLGFVNQSFAADEKLWESGINLFIQITKQDKSKSGKTLPNSHPVTLEQKDIAEALDLIKIWDKSYYEGQDSERVFTVQQGRLLGEQIEKGLKIAESNEDIIFQLVGRKKGMFGTSEPRYITGRIFYLNGKLNIILGDYDRYGDKLKELAYGQTGTEVVRYYFRRGKRAKASKTFKENIIKIDGIENGRVKSKIRRDWFVIDLEKTKSVIVARSNKKKTSSKEYKEALKKQAEALKLARERREIRLEMARLRKEIGESKNITGQSIEQRLENLDALKQKQLISDEEYQNKRTEILNDI